MNSVTSGAFESCASLSAPRADSSSARILASSLRTSSVATRRLLPVTSMPSRLAFRIESSAKFQGTSVTLMVTGTCLTDWSTTKFTPYCSVM